jgi:iron complex transport system substrate-binding protein
MKTAAAITIALHCHANAAMAAQAAAPPANPLHVMSLNLCTDQLLLQLLPPERIASVTYLSRSSAHSYLTAEAAGIPINYGTSEEVLAQQPDLVIAGNMSTPETRLLLKKVGVPLLEVPSADNFDEIRNVTRLVAHAVGEEYTGESLIAHMNVTLTELAATAPSRRIRVVGWDGSGNVPGKGTLFDSILTAAGGENVAPDLNTDMVFNSYVAFDIEQLLALQPDLIAYGNLTAERLDLAAEQLQHPVVRKLYANRQITYPETLYSCGLPQAADAARELRRAMVDAMANPEPAP